MTDKELDDLIAVAREISQYYEANRAKGHTTLMLDSIKGKDCFVVFPNMQVAGNFKDSVKKDQIKTIGNIKNGGLRGSNKPMVLDHYVIQQLLGAYEAKLKLMNEKLLKSNESSKLRDLEFKNIELKSEVKVVGEYRTAAMNYNNLSFFERLWFAITGKKISLLKQTE